MTDQQKNQRITALSRCGGVCEVCGKYSPMREYGRSSHGMARNGHRAGGEK